MIATSVIAVIVLLLAAFIVLVGSVARAPEGYEDAAGFHRGGEPGPARTLKAMVLDAAVVETETAKSPARRLAGQPASDHARGNR